MKKAAKVLQDEKAKIEEQERIIEEKVTEQQIRDRSQEEQINAAIRKFEQQEIKKGKVEEESVFLSAQEDSFGDIDDEIELDSRDDAIFDEPDDQMDLQAPQSDIDDNL